MINYDVVGFLATASRGQPVFEYLCVGLDFFYNALENISSYTSSIAIQEMQTVDLFILQAN